MNGFNYPKGSIWRKWDLHIHTKSDPSYTYRSNNSIATKEKNDDDYPRVFIEHIYSIEKLGAIAITDHNKADWIDELIKENQEYMLQGNRAMITIFPGVEIETSDGIHLLVIFNPNTQSEYVKNNFRKNTWKETIEHFLTVIKNQANPNTLKTTEEILEEAQKWDSICIFAHVTNDKGFFKISSGDRKTKIYKHDLTQIFQIPKDGTINNGYSKIINGEDPNYGNKYISKITASDAKKLEDIGKNNCWIKADPTFEGLKQIIYEPEERVYIGEEPPSKIDRNKVIRSITISNSNSWFEDNKSILFNDGLISIIGGKGTGKTAILDLIAYATRSYKCYEQDETKSKSFLKKAFKDLKDTNITVEWDDGQQDKIIIPNKFEESNIEGKVKYLPQDFIDQLCSEIGRNELEEQIENVIFQKIPPEIKGSYSDFKIYRESQLKIISKQKDRITKQIYETSLKICEYKTLIDSKAKKTNDIKKIEDEINKYDREMKEMSENLKNGGEQKEILKKLNSFIEQRTNMEKLISDFNTKILKTEEIMNDIWVFLEDSRSFTDNLKAILQIIGLAKEDIEKIKVVLYPENLEQIINSKNKEIEGKINNQKNELTEINKKIDELRGKVSLEKSKQDKINEINKSLSDLKKKKDSLNNEMKNIEEVEKKLKQLLEEREELFINYFEQIYKEKEKLKEIYSPLEAILKKSREENEKLFDLTIKFDFDIDTMAEKGHELIDLRADGIFRQSKPEILKEKLNELKFKLNFDENTLTDMAKNSIKQFINNIEELFTKDNRTIVSQLKEKYTELHFYNWLYSPGYYNISYSIKFNNIELVNLSPGLKGVALLILFLELDKEDKRPILIDQPEENLDNRSVYITLVKYFRNAKKRRQVIIVTHNPNLVVNTDSEQVIVANFDRKQERQSAKIDYVCGSLENTFKDNKQNNILNKKGIREHVCEILEGGQEAFEKREKKYGF